MSSITIYFCTLCGRQIDTDDIFCFSYNSEKEKFEITDFLSDSETHICKYCIKTIYEHKRNENELND